MLTNEKTKLLKQKKKGIRFLFEIRPEKRKKSSSSCRNREKIKEGVIESPAKSGTFLFVVSL